MNRFWVSAFIIGYSTVLAAACPRGDEVARQSSFQQAMPHYEYCAIQEDDDETQYRLAQVYHHGGYGLPSNVQRALLLYHLSAERGNAEAQLALAQLLTELDGDDVLREEIKIYLEKVKSLFGTQIQTSFRGELLHPYALLALAAEKPESKWFYQSTVRSAKGAADALKKYPIAPDKKAAALREATAWKNQKMLERAEAVLSVSEYQTFYQTLYPARGRSDDFTRSRALQQLKEKLTEDK